VSRGAWLVLAAAAWGARAALRRVRAYDLDRRVALVTGGSRGLGLAIARELAEAGAHVVVCARDAETLARARRDLEGRGAASVTAETCDVTDRSAVSALVARIEERRGPVDVLVNNASTITVGPVEHMTLDDYQEALAVNFWAALYTTLAVLPAMRRRGDGRIVNIASIGGLVSVPHLVPYSASKFALVGLSTGLSAELRRSGIRVTTVCPGLMRTGSPRNARFKGHHAAEHAWFSVADALPLVSMDAGRAARRIVEALRHGRATLTLTPMARVARTVNGLWPEGVAEVLALGHAILPGLASDGAQPRPGRESASAISPSWLTRLGDAAGRDLNQESPDRRSAPRTGSSTPRRLIGDRLPESA
jgi:NAD(P)-dependent dehydrogenase (short-subunit alcohol dehydrogenase family)